MYKEGKFLLVTGHRKSQRGELGLNSHGNMFFNSGKVIVVSEDKVLLPYIVNPNDNAKVIIHPYQFSVHQLYAICNKKLLHDSMVTYLADSSKLPLLDALGKATIVPYKGRKYSETFVLDALEAFGTDLRDNQNKEMDVVEWLREYKDRPKTHVPEDYDEEIPEKIKSKGVAY